MVSLLKRQEWYNLVLRRYSKKVKNPIPQDLTKLQNTCTGTPEESHFKFKIRLGSIFSLRKFLITLQQCFGGKTLVLGR